MEQSHSMCNICVRNTACVRKIQIYWRDHEGNKIMN